MSSRMVFARSAERHGYTVADVLFAYQHLIRRKVLVRSGERYLKFTGLHHGDPLVPSIEVMMKIIPGQGIVVFHVNAEQDGFWDKD